MFKVSSILLLLTLIVHNTIIQPKQIIIWNGCSLSEHIFETNVHCYYSMKYWRNWWQISILLEILNCQRVRRFSINKCLWHKTSVSNYFIKKQGDCAINQTIRFYIYIGIFWYSLVEVLFYRPDKIFFSR